MIIYKINLSRKLDNIARICESKIGCGNITSNVDIIGIALPAAAKRNNTKINSNPVVVALYCIVHQVSLPAGRDMFQAN